MIAASRMKRFPDAILSTGAAAAAMVIAAVKEMIRSFRSGPGITRRRAQSARKPKESAAKSQVSIISWCTVGKRGIYQYCRLPSIFISAARMLLTDAPVISWEDPFTLVRSLSCAGPCRKVCLRGRDTKCPGNSPRRCPPRIPCRCRAHQPDLYRPFRCPTDP